MSWLLIAIIAYFILAVVNLADKFILKSIIPAAKTYAFLVGIAGLIVFVAAPWLLTWPGWYLWFINMLSGAMFAIGLLFMYSALKNSEASKIFTLVGGVVPIIIVILSIIFFNESFTNYQFLAIALLVIGTIVISRVSVEHTIWFKVKEWLHLPSAKQTKSIAMALISALCFALYWVGSKYAFNTQPFFSALLWIRLGTFIAVLFLILRKKDREEIKEDLQESNQKKSNKFVFLGTQGLGALGGILQNYAVALGSVALVTSLQGLQYGLLLILVFLITIFKPEIIEENRSKSAIIKKVVAIVLIGLGLYFLAV